MSFSLNRMMLVAVMVILATNNAKADIFGMGANQFSIDFVPILGATNPTSGYGVVNNDYRMGTYEITNAQWDKFTASYGTVTGNPSSAYNTNPYYYTGASMPTINVSWYEAAQFVNWLNMSTGHQAAYKFTGTQGTSDYTLETWSAGEAAGGTNLYRNKDAFYYLPTEDEWVKAAYWNGSSLQTYATKAGESLIQGNGTSGTGWNYYTTHFATTPGGPWAVGSGSQELNGTYDMMGNVYEWMENPYSDANYGTSSGRGLRGGAFYDKPSFLAFPNRYGDEPTNEIYHIGFRVASAVPEPSTFVLLGMSGIGLLAYGWRRKRKSVLMALSIVALVMSAGIAQADVLNMGGTRNADGTWNGLASLETVPVGNINNAADYNNGYGSVDHAYNIGKYEVTAGQYTEFLNAKAKTDSYGLYNVLMSDPVNYLGCNIQQSGVSGSYSYSVAADWANRPVNYVSFWDAARFINWLCNGQGVDGGTETGAYTLTPAGIAANTVTKNVGSPWWIPSENEWYKAAYNNGGSAATDYFLYPTASNLTPSNVLVNPTDPGNNATFNNSGYTIGSPYYRTEVGVHENSDSPYGTFDQGGNAWEWNDSILYSSSRGLRGGGFGYDADGLASSNRSLNFPLLENCDIGFRVASAVPEPGSLLMTAMMAVASLMYWWRKRKAG